jgi:class 3 adenylate cyclase
MLAWRLGQFGYEVTLAEDGFKALEMLEQRAIDLVLLDVIMPEMNGYDVLEELKARDNLRGIPIIVVSALDGIDWVARCIAMGAEDYLAKPLDPVILKARIGASLEKKRLRDREVDHLAEIEQQKMRSDELLHVILPPQIVDELKTTNRVEPKRHEDVAVLFCDVVSFTPFCDGRPPQDIVSHLQHLVDACEELSVRYELQKIKTIGDSFMAAAGLLTPLENPVLNCVKAGLGMIAAAQSSPAQWNVRVGIHIGPVVSGVIGNRQYLFDLWGDTVNVAARMESQGVPGFVTLSRSAWDRIAEVCLGEAMGRVPIKGKGEQEMFRLTGFQR